MATLYSSDVVVGNDANAADLNNLRKDLRLAIKDPQTDTDGATITVDLSLGAVHKVTLGGNRTIAFSNPREGQSFMLLVKQDGTGNRTLVWPTVKWSDVTTPVLSTTAARVDIFAFFYDGTDYFGTIVGQNYG
jgi:hypothetical protein